MTQLVFNILAIGGVACFAGVMLCIGVTLGGFWRTLPPETFMEWFAANNHFISKSVSMVFIPAFIGMAGSLWSAWKTASFALWGSSAFCLLIVVVLTIGYFVPTNNAFASGGFSIELVSGNLNQWLLLHKARILLAVLSAVFGILAIATH